jgi:hypothetical protein
MGRMMYEHVHRCTTIARQASSTVQEDQLHDAGADGLASLVHREDPELLQNDNLEGGIPSADNENYGNGDDMDYQDINDVDNDLFQHRNADFNDLRNLDPAKGISSLETEVLKFLAVVEKGQGMSRNQATNVLAYLHTFNDPRLHCLPKTVDYCWQIVHKVMLLMHIKCLFYCAFHVYIVNLLFMHMYNALSCIN